MAKPIFDRRGQVAAWLHNDIIFNRSGSASAYVNGKQIVSFRGHAIGWEEQGRLLDHFGSTIAVLRGSTGGPIVPALAAVPAMPALAAVPARPAAPASPAQPRAVLSWSTSDFDAWLAT